MSCVSYAEEVRIASVRRVVRGANLYPAKRTIDVIASLSLLLFLLPVFAAIAVVLKIVAGGSIIYRQRRLGVGGVEFDCLKFRTMRTDADVALEDLLRRDPKARHEWRCNQKLANDPRVHRFGHILRISNLDELPQLINVLFGDMSMVGPRPIVASEAARYGDQFDIYKAMRPGITGIWQVRRQSDTTYDQRVAMDVEYFGKASAAHDAWLVIATAKQVLAARGSG